jgi:hypothetical protein
MLAISLNSEPDELIHITKCYSPKIHFHSSPQVIIFQQVSTKVVFHLLSAIMSYTFSASHLHNLTCITIIVRTINHTVIYLIIHIACLYHVLDQNIFLCVLFPDTVKFLHYQQPNVFREISREIFFNMEVFYNKCNIKLK